MYKFLISFGLVLMIMGCASFPAPEGQTSKASYVGDTASVLLSEVVVSVPVSEESVPYRNLHVSCSAILNTEKVSMVAQFQVENIIYRSKTKLSAEIVKELTKRGVINISDMEKLRSELVDKAQTIFDAVFSKWTYSDAFDVDIVITSMYFTDGSVGKNESGRRFW